ncbi:MAG: hypothetical protein IPM48_06735 [Saprospiraceae bacterium]|nr:hypothetical protein [Saprospiraceae bacterium]
MCTIFLDHFNRYTEYVDLNFEKLHSQKLIDFEDIFGEQWMEEKRNLYRYIAKYAGCKIVAHASQYDVKDLAEFILGKSFTETFKIEFQLKLGIKYLYDLSNNKLPNIYNSPILIFADDNDNFSYGGWTSYQWMSINWVLSKEIDKSKTTDFGINLEPMSIQVFEPEHFTTEDRFSDAMDKLEKLGKDNLDDCAAFFKSLIVL